MKGCLIPIEDDLYCIADRLREGDERYRVFRNTLLHRFEIHADGALQLAVPFDRLDARTVELIRRTRVENVSRLMEELDCDNARLERDELHKKRDMLLAAAEEVYEGKGYFG